MKKGMVWDSSFVGEEHQQRRGANFVGINSEGILHRVQNTIHDIVGTNYYFGNAGYKPRAWSYFGNYSVNSLVY